MSNATTILSGDIESVDSSNRFFSSEQVQSNLASLEVKYPEQYAFLNKTGLNSQAFMNPFTGEIDTESFQNVREQGSIVVHIASKIADELKRMGILSDDEYNEVISGAIAHNSLKRFEVFMKNTFPALTLYSEEWTSKLRSEIVDKKQILTPEEFERAVNMRNVMGHGSLKDFLVIQDGEVSLNPDRKISEMIVHIASDMVGAQNKKIKEKKGETYSADIQVSSFLERAKYADFRDAYPFLWKEGLAVSETQGVSIIEDIGTYVSTGGSERLQNYFDWQGATFELICQHICQRINLESSGNAIDVLMQLVNTQEVSGLVASVLSNTHTQLPE